MKSNIFKKNGQAILELAVLGSLILVAFSALIMYGQRLDMQQQIKMEAFRRAAQKAYQLNGSVSYTVKKDSRFFNLLSGFGQGQSTAQNSTASVMWQKGMSGDKGTDKSESYSFYRINDQDIVGSVDPTDPKSAEKGLPRYPKKIVDFTGKERTVWVPVSVWKEDQSRVEGFDSVMTKVEDPATGIRNIKSSNLSDTITTTLHTRVDIAKDPEPWDKISPLPDYKNEGVNYDFEGTPYTVSALDKINHGAYYNSSTNRVEYKKEAVGQPTTIHRERTWATGDED